MSNFPQFLSYPESVAVMRRHVVASICLSVRSAVLQMVPFLLKALFKAPNYQSVLATMMMPAMHLGTVVWGQMYRRSHARRYLWLFLLLGVLPLAGIGLSRSAPAILLWLAVASLASPALIPMAGDILRACYSPGVRGRVYAWITVASMLSQAAVSWGVGLWLDRDGWAFRIYMPLAVVVQFGGVAVLAWIARQPLFVERQQAILRSQPWPTMLRWSVQQMVAVLRRDRAFLRFEIAFMLYGVGWMISYALLPLLGNNKLHLTYSQFALSTQVTLPLVTVLAIPLIGYAVDRIGPLPIATTAFAWLALYPIMLIAVVGTWSLLAATALYALGMAAVQTVWMVGPVTMARQALDASHYTAIHATMTGVRSLLFQPLGWLLYEWTGTFWIPLVVAAAGFAAGAYCMYTVPSQQRQARRAQGSNDR